jgi:hypothetical protein
VSCFGDVGERLDLGQGRLLCSVPRSSKDSLTSQARSESAHFLSESSNSLSPDAVFVRYWACGGCGLCALLRSGGGVCAVSGVCLSPAGFVRC